MSGYLIKDTTKEEREAIVAESLGNISATCDGCSAGIVEMYQAYICLLYTSPSPRDTR